MIVASGIELRAGPRLLLDGATFRIAPGDRVGLVGRNGAGKTTLTKVLAGEAQAAAGTVTRSGDVGYLPQDPRTGDLTMLARDRILSARGLDTIVRDLRATEKLMASEDDAVREKAMARYARLDAAFNAQGGYAAESEAARIASALGLDDRILDQPLRTLSGGQRRRVELTRILFSGAPTLLLDEPTNHLDADSIGWLRDFLRGYQGGLVVISHDVEMLDTVVNRVFHLDANRAEMDLYNVGWKAYLTQRETDERRRKRERQNAEKKAGALMAQADKMRAKATKAVAAQNMARRAERLLAGLEGERVSDKVAKIRFPDPAPSGRTPLRASGLSRSYGSLEVFTDVDLAIDRGSRVVVLGLNGAGKTTLLRILAGVDDARHRRGRAGPRAEARLLRPGAREPRRRPHRAGQHEVGRPRARRDRRAEDARLVPLLRRRRRQAGPGALRRREDAAVAGHARRVVGQRAAARRAHQQPRPRVAPGDPRRAAHLQGRRRPGHPRRGCGRGAGAGAGAAAARTASRTSGVPTTATSSRSPDLASTLRAVTSPPQKG